MIPLISIVVPTKNRYFYLENFVSSFIAFQSADIELIIQDNSDVQSKEFLSFLDQANDKRIKYNFTPGWLSVVENCEIGIDAASAQYICMLGDDDGMLFNTSLDVIKYSIANNHDAVIVNKAEYYWPDTSHAVWKDLLAGNLFYKKYSFETKIVSIKDELVSVLKEGASSSLRSLPRVYHGFIKKDTLKKLKSLSGSYFPGPSPDMANAIGLAQVVESLVEIDVPAVISGHSKKSGGGMGAEKKHHGRIEDQSFLPKETSKLWSNKIPKFWSGATIYAESAKEALLRTNSADKFKVNFTYLWAYCLVFESKYFTKIIPVILKNPLQIPLLVIYVFQLTFFRGSNYIKNYFKFNNKSSLFVAAESIFKAQDLLADIVGQKILFISKDKSKN